MRIATEAALQLFRERVAQLRLDRASMVFFAQVLCLSGLDFFAKRAIQAVYPVGKYQFFLGHLLLIGHVQHEVGRNLPLLIVVCLFFFGVCLFRVPSRAPLLRYPLTVALGGILANSIEAAVFGHATDWLSVLPEWRQSINNLADLFILVGVAWYVLNSCRMLLAGPRERNR